jgi:hypothetical protein
MSRALVGRGIVLLTIVTCLALGLVLGAHSATRLIHSLPAGSPMMAGLPRDDEGEFEPVTRCSICWMCVSGRRPMLLLSPWSEMGNLAKQVLGERSDKRDLSL